MQLEISFFFFTCRKAFAGDHDQDLKFIAKGQRLKHPRNDRPELVRKGEGQPAHEPDQQQLKCSLPGLGHALEKGDQDLGEGLERNQSDHAGIDWGASLWGGEMPEETLEKSWDR